MGSADLRSEAALQETFRSSLNEISIGDSPLMKSLKDPYGLCRPAVRSRPTGNFSLL
jgi:hypothetical protein